MSPDFSYVQYSQLRTTSGAKREVNSSPSIFSFAGLEETTLFCSIGKLSIYSFLREKST